MNFEKFNLTEITNEQLPISKGVEIWRKEQDEKEVCVNMYGNERTFILTIIPYGDKERHFLMTLIEE